MLEYGIYNKYKNPNGVCRDHIFSIHNGWILEIPHDIISHPANCQFLSNSENSKKNTSSWVTLEELKERISKWDQNVQMLQISPKPTPKSDKIKQKKQRSSIKFRYVIQNKISNEVYETNNITKWSMQQGFVKSTVYNNTKEWAIIEKYEIKTGKRLI